MKPVGGLFGLSIPLVEMLRAKAVLNDAQVALELAQGQQGSFAEWRVHWTAVCALLRTVGDVFFKVDAKHFIDYRVREQIRRRFDELGATKPEPRIFWEFIKQERDNILHEHQFGTVRYERRSDGTLVPISIGGMFGLGIPGAVPAPVLGYEQLISNGPFADQPALEVATDALRFWNTEFRLVFTRAGIAFDASVDVAQPEPPPKTPIKSLLGG